MGKYLYFAYGSNMLTKRIQDPKRAPSAKFVTVGYTKKHKFTFHKVSKDGSGKCDAEESRNKKDRVYGVVFEIDEIDKSKFDRAEGLGFGYCLKNVRVKICCKSLKTVTYYATNKDNSLSPYHWYKDLVLCGAREHDLPEEYIKVIEQTKSIDDPDRDRASKERAIFKCS